MTALNNEANNHEAKSDGGPAYPQNFLMHDDEVITSGNLTAAGYQGLSLRDWFAGQVMVSIAKGSDPETAAVKAYAFADALLEARK